jgi:hypothetical protein
MASVVPRSAKQQQRAARHERPGAGEAVVRVGEGRRRVVAAAFEQVLTRTPTAVGAAANGSARAGGVVKRRQS